MVRRGILVFVILITSLCLAWPVAAARQVEVDVLLLVDTSDSMADELQALCSGIDGLVDDMARRGVRVNVDLLGIAETRACADQSVAGLLSESRVEDPEDWGIAVADLARHYTWRPEAARLLVPVSDEGPSAGDPVDADDEQAIQTAIRAARDNDVTVSPVLGTDFNPEIEPLARDLAQETGGQVLVSEDPPEDLPDGLRDLVLDVADRARAGATLPEAIPTPLEILLDGQVISTNLVAAILLTLVLGVATAILIDTLGDGQLDPDDSLGGRFLALLFRLVGAVGRLSSPGEWSQLTGGARRLLAVAQLALFLVLMAFLALFLQPGFNPISWQGLGLGVGAFLLLLLLNLALDGSGYMLARRAGGTPVLRLRPESLPTTLLSVLLSRVFGFVPGYFYGRATRCVFDPPPARPRAPDLEPPAGDDPPEETGLSRPQRARIALAGLGVVGAIGLSLWGLSVPASLLHDFFADLDLPQWLGDGVTGLMGMARSFFSLGFFLAWQMLFFELLPLRSTAGGVVYRRNRFIWAAIALGTLFVLLHALVNPFGTAGELFESGGLVMLLLASLLYSALAVGMWLYTALRTESRVAADRQLSQRTAVMAISLIVMWVLGACGGLVVLVARLLG